MSRCTPRAAITLPAVLLAFVSTPAFRAVLGADRGLRVEGFGEPVTLTQAGAR